ncbi:MAG: hypothetical protein U1F67_19025 [Rubrivivax sp.]
MRAPSSAPTTRRPSTPAASHTSAWSAFRCAARGARCAGAQGGLYTLAQRDADDDDDADANDEGRPRRACASSATWSAESSAPNPRGVLEAIAAPATRIVSLTVTEKGYALDPASGRLREEQPDIAHDLRVGTPLLGSPKAPSARSSSASNCAACAACRR